MNTQHTPGQWSIQPLAANVWNVTHHITAKDRNLPVAMVHGEANARLIAAAPELLDILKEIIIQEVDSAKHGIYGIASSLVAQAQDAIAKATQP